jgi:hypothetical protein
VVLEELRVVNAPGFDASICRQLSAFPFLVSLDVRFCRYFTDQALAWLSYCRALRNLNVTGCLVTEVGLRSLWNVRSLRSVALMKTRVRRWHLPYWVSTFKGPASALKPDSSLSGLTMATFWGVTIDAADLFGSLGSLRELTLVADPAFDYPDFGVFPFLERLCLVNGHISSGRLPAGPVRIRLHKIRLLVNDWQPQPHILTFSCTVERALI